MVDERTAYWGAREDARYRTRDDDPTGGDYVVAETLDANGDPVDVLLRWDDTAGEWVSGGPVEMGGNDLTNVGSLDTGSVSTGILSIADTRFAQDGTIIPGQTIGSAVNRFVTTSSPTYEPAIDLLVATIPFDQLRFEEVTPVFQLSARLIPGTDETAYMDVRNETDTENIGVEISATSDTRVSSGWVEYSPPGSDPKELRAVVKTEPAGNTSDIYNPTLQIGYKIGGSGN